MASQQMGLEGPDLEAGVALADLPEAEPFLGYAGSDPVVLVRRGTDVLGIGAECTHYGGPLAEGLVVGETIRCPWHHACFSIRTGEALGAPALNPLPRWRVDVRDGRAYVRGREEAEPLATFGRRASGPESVVIVGAGAAGTAAAETLRREGYEGAITLIDPDPDAPYDRPNLSKDYLAGNAPDEWLPLRPAHFYAEHHIDRVVAGVDSVNVQERSVQLTDGRVLRFGALLLATGAVPMRLEIPGADLPHVHMLRSLADCRAVMADAEEARRVVVLGASFIGMEAAASLRSRGLAVTVVAPDVVPFQRTLGAEVGRALQATHEEHGVEFRLGRRAAEVQTGAVRLDDGSELPADLVVVGIGVKPDTRLAEAAWLRVDDGVIVDQWLETSSPGVFAAGDIARYPDPYSGQQIRVEHWVVAQRQGQAAALNILGRDLPFVDAPFFWTRQWDFGISYVGHAPQWDEVRVEGDLAVRDATVRYLSGETVRALATVGRDLESLEAEAAMVSAAIGEIAALSLAPR